MTDPTLSAGKALITAPLAGSLLRQAVMGRLRLLRQGWLQVRHGETVLDFGDRLSPLRAVIDVRNEALWGMVACNGSIGAGEAYIQGYWSSPD
ncbi:SAM-dependent methyltransferase, partial [Pseudomonas aeruginosa]|nr:SAM-dependent methyltransferase [Pseudomonas aeruginosa]